MSVRPERVEPGDGDVAFWVGLVVGGAVAGVGVAGLLREKSFTHPTAAARYLVGGALGHDLVLVPVVLVVGTIVKRLVPAWLRPWVSGGLIVSGAVALLAWPFVRGYGRLANNPSILPRNYAHGLLVVLACVWAATLVAAVVARAARRRRDQMRVSPPSTAST